MCLKQADPHYDYVWHLLAAANQNEHPLLQKFLCFLDIPRDSPSISPHSLALLASLGHELHPVGLTRQAQSSRDKQLPTDGMGSKRDKLVVEGIAFEEGEHKHKHENRQATDWGSQP